MISTIRKYRPYYISNLKVALPVMLSQAGQVAVHIADNIMVGHHGAVDLAASSFANSIYILGFLLCMGISFGLTPLVGAAFGKKNHKKASLFLYHSIVLNILFSMLVMLVMWILSYYLGSMGQTENVALLSIPYFRVSVIGLLPSIIFLTFKQFIEGLGNTRIVMFITLAGNVVNVILNYFLIYGKLGFPELGLLGAGYATLISRIFMTVLLLSIVWLNPVFSSYVKQIDYKRFNKRYLYKVFTLGLPIGLQMLSEVTLFSMAAIMVGWIGESELAAHQVALSASVVSFMIATGISSGTTIRVSHQLGAGHMPDVKRAGMASAHLVVTFMGFCAILFLLFRNNIPYVFLNVEDIEIVHMASGLLIMSAIFQIFDGTQVVMFGALRGLSDVYKSFLIALFSYVIVGLPMVYVLGITLNLGVKGIWAGLSISIALAAILLFLRFKRLADNLIKNS